METELSVLQDIRAAVWMLAFIVGIGVAAQVARLLVVSYKAIKSAFENYFYLCAAAMFERQEFTKLIKYCHDHLRKHPREAYAYWFLGKAHFELTQLDEAENYFKKTIDICPSWGKDWVEPFIERIKQKRTPIER